MWHASSLTLDTLTSVCIFSILFSIHFLRCWQGEFVEQSRASLVDDHSLYSWPKCLTEGWNCKEKSDAGHSKGLTLKLPWVTKTEFLLTISMLYQPDKWWD